MDLWGKLLGFDPPEVTILEGERWINLPISPKVERALAKRAAKERWDVEAGAEFHALCVARKAGIASLGDDALDIDVCGVTVLTLQGEDAAATLARMRAGKSGVVAAPARARRTDADSWQLEVSIL